MSTDRRETMSRSAHFEDKVDPFIEVKAAEGVLLDLVIFLRD